jgi:hypothetical protein
MLTLEFSLAIDGLCADDVTLAGIDGLVKGKLSGSGPVYELEISGFTAGGTVEVSVEKEGYDIENSFRTAAVYYMTPVAFSSVAANGSSTSTSTTLTLKFSEAIAGLTAADITLSGIAGLVKGNLSGSGPSYTLPISGFTAGGTLAVSVAKEGYDIGTPERTVAVYYYDPISVTLSSVAANGSSSSTSTALTLTFSAAIAGLAASDISLSGVSGISKGTLSASGGTYTLPISGFTAGGTLTVSVSKSGYAISGSPKTVTVYYIVSLSAARQYLAAASVGSYALFGGGGSSAVVDAFNSSLTRITPTALSSARLQLAAASVGSYALFGGGGSSAVVDAYDAALTRTTPTALSSARSHLAATSVGSYALFGGGSTGSPSAVADAYNGSLTRTTPTALSSARQQLAATSVGSYALFGGGNTGSTSPTGTQGPSAVVDAYDAALTRTTPTALSSARQQLAAASVGSYALFGGGCKDDISGSSYISAVDSYNSSLSRTTPTALSSARRQLAAAGGGSYAVFGGGIIYGGNGAGSSKAADAVDLYNSSLTRTVGAALREGRSGLAAASVSGYAIFAGGSPKGETIDVYSV